MFKCGFPGNSAKYFQAPDPALLNFMLPSQSIIKYPSMQFEFGKKAEAYSFILET